VSLDHVRMGVNRHPQARLVTVPLVAAVLLVFHGFGFEAGQAVDRDATFRLQVSADGRHLADRSGRPFLVEGDTAWSLGGDEGFFQEIVQAGPMRYASTAFSWGPASSLSVRERLDRSGRVLQRSDAHAIRRATPRSGRR
jgi:hypothetical protein